MPTFLYRGFNSEGRRLGGSGQFASEAQMTAYLNEHSIVNYEIFKSETAYKHGAYSLVSPKDLSVFCKQLSVLFDSHIMLMEGVSLLSDQTDNKQLKLTLSEVYGFMERGSTFAEAICMYEHIFSAYLLSMIEIGETSGTLDTVFSRMSVYFNKEHKVRRRLRQAVMYPAALTALMAAIVVLLVVKILPMFQDILESMGAQIPWASQAILNAGSFLAISAPIFIFVLIAAVVAGSAYARTDKGRYTFDKAKFYIPAYRHIQTRIISARFARSLAILLKSGVQFLNALQDVCALMDNQFLCKKLAEATAQIKNGGDPADVLSKIDLFPALFIKMFIIGYKTGSLDEMLEKTASVFDDEADDAIERFTAVLEPALIIVLSIVVGVILLSVMIPMITIMNAIG